MVHLSPSPPRGKGRPKKMQYTQPWFRHCLEADNNFCKMYVLYNIIAYTYTYTYKYTRSFTEKKGVNPLSQCNDGLWIFRYQTGHSEYWNKQNKERKALSLFPVDESHRGPALWQLTNPTPHMSEAWGNASPLFLGGFTHLWAHNSSLIKHKV